MVREGIVLGHKISYKTIKVNRVKIELIGKKCLHLQMLRVLEVFWDMLVFIVVFIKNFSKISKSLCDLLSKDVEFNFDDACLVAFN